MLSFRLPLPLLVAFLFSAALVPAAAQPAPPTSLRVTIDGLVLDETGASLHGAQLRLTPRSATGTHRTTTSDPSGAFRFADVPFGDYDLVTTAALFSAHRQALRVGTTPHTVTVVLKAGAFSEEVTVVGTRVGDSPDTLQRLPGAVTLLDAATLAGSQVFTVNEALRKVPGVNVREEEGLGLRPNIGIRGLNPTRSTKVLLLEDGVPFTMAPYGDNASYYHPPIERFSDVEVLKGSGQIAYGPSTIGGIVNYLTPPVPARPSATARLAFGSRGYVNATGAFGLTRGRVGVLVDAMRKQGDGARQHIHSAMNDVTAKLQVTPVDGHSLTLKVNYYGEDSTLTYSGLTQAEYDTDPRQNPFANDAYIANRVGVTGTWRASLTPALLMTMNVYQSSFNRDWWRQSSNSAQRPNDRNDPACGSMANLNTTCGNEGRLREYDLWGVEPRFRATPTLWGVRGETDFGVRFHAERQDREQRNGDTPRARDGILVEDNLRENTAVSAFVQHRLLMGRLTLTPGLRVENIRYRRTNRLANGGEGVSGATELTQWIPGVGATLAPSSSTTLFAGVHRGFAPPRTEDVINNTTGGVVDLAPELSWDTEIGVRWMARSGARVDATWFLMDYGNQIVPASLAGGIGATLTNGGETQHRGLEFSGRIDTAGFVRTRHNFFARIAYTWLPVAKFTGARFSSVAGAAAVSVTGNRLPYAPEHLSSLTVGYQHPAGVEAQVEGVQVSRQFGDDLNSVLPSADGQRGLLPGSTLWNAAVSYRILPLHSALFITVKNLGNLLYIADRARGVIPGMPRLVQAGIRVAF